MHLFCFCGVWELSRECGIRMLATADEHRCTPQITEARTRDDEAFNYLQSIHFDSIVPGLWDTKTEHIIIIVGKQVIDVIEGCLELKYCTSGFKTIFNTSV